MIQVYYGDGKGKTSAAIGAGMRAKGAGQNVLLVQFLKDKHSHELKTVPFDVFEAPDKVAFNPGEEYAEWVENAYKAIMQSECEFIILDELLDVIPRFIPLEDALWTVRSLSIDEGKEVIITGHKEIEKIFAAADYVTHMKKIKHPYDSGVSAREGIEY